MNIFFLGYSFCVFVERRGRKNEREREVFYSREICHNFLHVLRGHGAIENGTIWLWDPVWYFKKFKRLNMGLVNRVLYLLLAFSFRLVSCKFRGTVTFCWHGSILIIWLLYIQMAHYFPYGLAWDLHMVCFMANILSKHVLTYLLSSYYRIIKLKYKVNITTIPHWPIGLGGSSSTVNRCGL